MANRHEARSVESERVKMKNEECRMKNEEKYKVQRTRYSLHTKLHSSFFILHSSFFIFHSSFNRNGFSCMNIKKGLTLQPNLVNLKSNTMKNTLQRYSFFSFFKQKKNIFLFFL